MTFNIYYFISLISMVLCGGTFLGYCMDQLVPALKENAGYRMLLWTVIPLVSMAVKTAVMDAQNIALVIAIANIFYFGGTIWIVWRYYEGKMSVRFRMYAALMCMTIAGDLTFGILYQLFNGQPLEIPTYNTAGAALGCAGTAVIGSIYMILVVWLVNRKKQSGRLYIPGMLILLALFVCAGMVPSEDTQTVSYDATVVFVTACILLVLYLFICIFFVLEQIRSTNREREAFSRALQMEQARYEAIEERREELAKLRHDYRNMLTTVTLLLENGDTQKARELLADMSQRAVAAGEEEAC